MLTVFDLAFHYIERFYDSEPSTEEKRQILTDFEDLLAYGWSLRDINKVIKHFIVGYPGERPDIPKLFSKVYKREENLLSPDKFYYHNQLRVTPGPPKRWLDIDSGEIKKVEEPFYLEMRASYTIDDLIDYYLKQFGLTAGPDERKRIVGSFKYLLKTYHVENLLFMIDVASNTVYSEDMDRYGFNVFKLADYKTLAEEQLSQKRTENKISGDDRIVPRKRVLSFRSSHSV